MGKKQKILVSIANDKLAYEPVLEFELDAGKVGAMLTGLKELAGKKEKGESKTDEPTNPAEQPE